MKYLILLLTLILTSCYTCERLELCNKKLNIIELYNKTIQEGSIVQYNKSSSQEILFYEFKSQISNREVNEIYATNYHFKQKHKLIGKFEHSSNILTEKEISRKDIENASKEIGAKYTLAYKFHRVNSIDDYNNKAFVYSGGEQSIYYLILFFADKDE